MNINDLTIGQAKELAAMLGGRCAKSTTLKVGAKVLIRAVTHYYTGRVAEITELEVRLEDSAWIADTGRFSDALKTGELNEVEPYPDGNSVMLGAIVDYAPWPHELPRERK